MEQDNKSVHCLQCGKKLNFFSNKFEVNGELLCSNKCYVQYKKHPKSVRTLSVKNHNNKEGNKCQKCGRKNSPNDDFCEECGNELKKTSNGGRGYVWKIIGTLIAIFLILKGCAILGIGPFYVETVEYNRLPEIETSLPEKEVQPESIPESIPEVEPPKEVLNFQTPLIENLDCSKVENFKKTQIKFGIGRSCKSEDFTFLVDSLSECNAQGGEYVPWIFYESYPSLNEYPLQGFRLNFENIGCTKIPLNDFRVDVFLYHKNNLIIEQLNNEIESYLREEDMLYPKDNPWPRIFFKETLTLTDPNDYNLKAQLVYLPSDKIIAEDEVNFNMVKDYFK